jgi:hypothetical protein
MTYNMINIQKKLHQTLHHSQIYNFTLNHDYKFKTIIVLKDDWISRFKRYMFFFLEMNWTHGSHFMEYIYILERFGEHLTRISDFETKIPICSCDFLQCIKHIKGILKHGEFSWKICSCNFESIRIYLKNETFFLICNVSMMIFQNFKNSLKSMSTHFVARFFMLSPQCITCNKPPLFAQRRKKKSNSFLNQ